MNESGRETIDTMLDYIAHLEITRYGAFARSIASGLQIPQDDHLHEGDWMDGFVTALEWVIAELNGVQEVSPDGSVTNVRRGAAGWHRTTFIGSQEEE